LGGAAFANDFVPKPGMPFSPATKMVVGDVSCLPQYEEMKCDINPDKCITFEQAKSDVVYKRVETKAELNNIFGLNGSGNLNLSSLKVQIEQARFLNSENTHSKILSLIYYYQVGWTAKLKPEVLVGAKNVVDDEEKEDSCSKGYVSSAHAGIMAAADIEVEFTSADKKQEIGGKVKVAYKETANLEGVVDALDEQKDSIEKISIYFSQSGGNPFLLSQKIDPKAILGCNFSSPEGVKNCHLIMEKFADYTKGLQSKDGGINSAQYFDPKVTNVASVSGLDLFYSQPKGALYNSSSATKITIEPAIYAQMEAVVRKNEGLARLYTEVNDLKSTLDSLMPHTKSMVITLDGLMSDINSVRNNMDPENWPFNQCFGGRITKEGCAESLKVTNEYLSNLFDKPNMKFYLEYKPRLSYRIRGVPLLLRENGEYEGKFNFETATCEMYKTEKAGNHYQLYCPNRDPISPGGVELKVTDERNGDNKEKKLVLGMGELTSCTTLKDLSDKDSGGKKLLPCPTIIYSGPSSVLNDSDDEEWQWTPTAGSKIKITGSSHSLFEPTEVIQPFRIVSTYDGYNGWKADLLRDSAK